MKELVCKKCGNNALELHDDIYECKACHAKFLLQEFDNIDSKNPFTNTDNASQLDTIYQLAENALMNKDYLSAIKHYETANNIDPSNWKAMFYIEYCKCLNSTISEISINALRFADSSETILKQIHSTVTDEKELKNVLFTVAQKVNEVSYTLGLIMLETQPELSRINETYKTWLYICFIGYIWGNHIVNIFGQKGGSVAAVCWIFSVEKENRFLNSFQQWLPQKDVQEEYGRINRYVTAIKEYKSDFSLSDQQPSQQKSSSDGCYIATCVYGSYDCPQVWTLRRYRDNTLAKTWYGRAFIHIYYTISPILVRSFGHTNVFRKIWRKRLDSMIKRLHAQGVKDTPYQDKKWLS